MLHLWKGEHTEGTSHYTNIFQDGKLIWSDSLGVDMLASHILCTKEGKIYTHWSPNHWYSLQQRKNYKYSCKLNKRLILPLTVHFPMWLFRSESQNICQPTEIHDDEETTRLKVTWVHWVDGSSLLRQLRRHYISTWLSPGMQSNVFSRESSKAWMFLQHGQ